MTIIQANAVPIDKGIASDSAKPLDVKIKCITGTIIKPPPTPNRPAMVPVTTPTTPNIRNSTIIFKLIRFF